MHAIIDLGSNTVRLNVYQVIDQKVSLVFSKKEFVSLASYVNDYQQLSEEGIFDENEKFVLPENPNILGTMWVLNIKRDKNTGDIDKYKARLVVLGNSKRARHIKKYPPEQLVLRLLSFLLLYVLKQMRIRWCWMSKVLI
jgi:hypothetical protein